MGGTSSVLVGMDVVKRGALGVGGLERAVRDNGAEPLSQHGAWYPLARTWRAVAAGAECPAPRRDTLDLPRGAMN